MKNSDSPSDIVKSLKKLNKNGVAKETITQIAEETGERGLKVAKRCGNAAAKLIAEQGGDVLAAFEKVGKKYVDQAANLITNYGKSATNAIAKSGNSAVEALGQLSAKGSAKDIIDKAAELITKHGDDTAEAIIKSEKVAVEALEKVSDDLFDKASQLIARHGDETAKAIIKYSDNAVNALKNVNKNVVTNAAKLINNYGDNVIGLVEKYGGKYGNALINDVDNLFNSVTKVSADNSLECIGKISMRHPEYVDDTVKSVAQELKNRINSGMIKKTSGGKLNESVVTVAIDKSNEKMFYGISGFKNPTWRAEGKYSAWLTEWFESLKNYISTIPGKANEETLMSWKWNNCGEFNALANAFENGCTIPDGKIKNISLYSIYIDESKGFIPPCDNCRFLYGEYINFISE